MSGYYTWRKREPGRHSREDAFLAEKIVEAFQHNRRVYGSPRLHAELRAQGYPCARKRVARLMQEQGLCAKRPQHRTTTTHSHSTRSVAVPVTITKQTPREWDQRIRAYMFEEQQGTTRLQGPLDLVKAACWIGD